MVSIKKQVEEAVAVLKKGGIVVFPTETAYGLAADATNENAVKKVFQIKGREAAKSVPLIAKDVAMARRFMKLTPCLQKLAARHWPGALTIVGEVTPPRPTESVRSFGRANLPSGEGRKRAAGVTLANGVVRKDATVAIRVSSSSIARSLSAGVGAPIVATSANRSGMSTCYSIRAVKRQLKNIRMQPDLYLDIGALPRRKPSTLVREENGTVIVLRQGSVVIARPEPIEGRSNLSKGLLRRSRGVHSSQ